MRKVRLNESQLRRLVREMVKESNTPSASPRGMSDDGTEYSRPVLDIDPAAEDQAERWQAGYDEVSTHLYPYEREELANLTYELKNAERSGDRNKINSVLQKLQYFRQKTSLKK
jgi:hypothetical protein